MRDFKLLSRRSSVVALFGVACVVALGMFTGPARSQSSVAEDNGAAPVGAAAGSRLTAAPGAPVGGMSIISSDRGRVTLSMNALGTLNASGTISIRKPAGATVRRAVLFAVTTGFQNAPISGPVALNGQSIVMEHELASGIRSFNYWTDVTTSLKPMLDSAAAGSVAVSVSEPSSSQVDGTVLAVVFDDPAQLVDQSVGLVFGALQTGGDVFSLTLDRPFLPSDPLSKLEMSLGISYGCQSPASCGGAGQQYSIIDVNGQRLTTSAGGEDDGASRNGALITVGGVGDSLDNPVAASATPVGTRSDDELYDLRPFVAPGARTINVETTNPSNDDNVFLAAFVGNPPLSITTSTSDCPPSTEVDSDGDCLPDTVEVSLGTSVTNPDTDGDGLLDSWEAPRNVTGAGLWIAGVKTDRDEVFGLSDGTSAPMYANGSAAQCRKSHAVDDQLRVSSSGFPCYNHRPNPLRKDVYLEIDWMDCQKGDCPEAVIPFSKVGIQIPGTPIVLPPGLLPDANIAIDPTHHAPHVDGLGDLVDMFKRMNVTNPDGTTGVSLNIVVDERVTHVPTCGELNPVNPAIPGYFGSKAQRLIDATAGNSRFLNARTKAVRQVLSGHAINRPGVETTPTLCPLPGLWSLIKTSFGAGPLPSYDYSEFGSANGSQIYTAISGPSWICYPVNRLDGFKGALLSLGELTPVISLESKSMCYRNTRFKATLPPSYQVFLMNPGIFPTHLRVKASDPNTRIDIPAPVQMLLGENAESAGRQLWSRSLAALLGRSMGLTEVEAANFPVVLGRTQTTRNKLLPPVLPGDYLRTTDLRYAPYLGAPVSKGTLPPLAELFNEDSDGDGIANGTDNCPVVYNPGQTQSDFRVWSVKFTTYVEWGIACDGDLDGDSKPNEPVAEASLVNRASGVTTTAVPPVTSINGIQLDQFPNDTDNDGIENPADSDIDGDLVANVTDNCTYFRNPTQANADNDLLGDLCDNDADGDGEINNVELLTGSHPLNVTSKPEFLDAGLSCGNGLDDDGDGNTDLADSGCVDTDGDTAPDAFDNCKTVPNYNWLDKDNDGIGDRCDATIYVELVNPTLANAQTTVVEVTASTTATGDWFLSRTDACSGPTLGGSPVTASTPIAGNESTIKVTVASLADGVSTLWACLQSSVGTDRVPVTIAVDRIAPDTSLPTGVPEGAIVPGSTSFSLGSNEVGATFECSPDGFTWRDCNSPVSVDSVAGANVFFARAIDIAGNTDPSPATRRWTNSAPTIGSLLAMWDAANTAGEIPVRGFYVSERNRLERVQGLLVSANKAQAILELERFVDDLAKAGRDRITSPAQERLQVTAQALLTVLRS